MNLYNDLVRTYLDGQYTSDELRGIQNRTGDAVSDLMLGISAIGSLMYWSADNENYTEGTAKDDMYRIGAMLGTIGEVVRALGDTSANAAFSHSISGKESKARAGK